MGIRVESREGPHLLVPHLLQLAFVLQSFNKKLFVQKKKKVTYTEDINPSIEVKRCYKKRIRKKNM